MTRMDLPTEPAGGQVTAPHRRVEPAPQPGGTFGSAEQMSPPTATETSDLPDQEP